MPSGKYVIIGLGSIGLLLVRMLSKDFNLVCIDTNEAALEEVHQLRGETAVLVKGDATSRLVLEEAGVAGADTVVITATTEKINVEIARVLYHHFEVPRVVAVGVTQKGITELEALEVEVESIFSVSAIGLRNRLEHKTKAVQGIGLGKNEILEVEVHGYSRLANKPLASLNPKSWRIGLIYREGNIIVPAGETVLRARDKVVLLGDPKVLKTVADLLTFRFTHFPLEYGDTLVALIGPEPREAYLEEIAYLLSVFPLEKALFVLTGPSEALTSRLRTLATQQHVRELHLEVAAQEDHAEAVKFLLQDLGRRAALTVVDKTAAVQFWRFNGSRSGSRGKRFLQKLAQAVGCPIVLAGGSFPYRKVALPCLAERGLQHALETTMEMSAAIHYQIFALFVLPSRYISSEEEETEFERMKKIAVDMGLMYKASVRQIDLEGNPVNAVIKALEDCQLMVNEAGSWRAPRWSELLQPDVLWRIVRGSPISTLVIPPLETLG